MDDADQASLVETLDREAAIHRVVQRTSEKQLVVGGKVFCLGCGEPISSKRLTALPEAVRCIECQRELER